MEKILTVVIPSYNVEKYLHQTLNSFLAEEVFAEVEVVVVDDGSKDRTAEIGQEYADKYPDTFKVISKPNGGHGSTINKGIEVARGKYFKVVDGDDWVNTGEFVKLVHALSDCDADYVIADYNQVDDNTQEETLITFPVLKGKNLWKFNEIADKMEIPMHALVIKTSILKENHIHIDENSFYVDVEYTLFPVPYVETVAYYPFCVYQYRVAQVAQSVSIKGFQKHMQNHIDVTLHLCEFLKEYSGTHKEELKINHIANRVASMVGDQAGIFTSFSPFDKEIRRKFIEFDREIAKKSKKVYELSDSRSKVLHLLRKTNFRFYPALAFISRMHNRR